MNPQYAPYPCIIHKLRELISYPWNAKHCKKQLQFVYECISGAYECRMPKCYNGLALHNAGEPTIYTTQHFRPQAIVRQAMLQNTFAMLLSFGWKQVICGSAELRHVYQFNDR